MSHGVIQRIKVARFYWDTVYNISTVFSKVPHRICDAWWLIVQMRFVVIRQVTLAVQSVLNAAARLTYHLISVDPATSPTHLSASETASIGCACRSESSTKSPFWCTSLAWTRASIPWSTQLRRRLTGPRVGYILYVLSRAVYTLTWPLTAPFCWRQPFVSASGQVGNRRQPTELCRWSAHRPETTCRTTWRLPSRCSFSASVLRFVSSPNHCLTLSWTKSLSLVDPAPVRII